MPHTNRLAIYISAVLLSGAVSLAAESDTPKTCSPDGVCTAPTSSEQAPNAGKYIWANTHLYADAPMPEMRKWLTKKPEMEGKFLVVEFWRTWCGACRHMTPLMNTLQKKYGNELVVIGITGETEEKVKAYNGPKKEYSLALDQALPPNAEAQAPKPADAANAAPAAGQPDQATGANAKHQGEQGVYEASFGVWGWPHVVILEPLHRTVVWEGFTGLKGYELTEEKVEKILAIGRAMKAEEDAQKKK